MTTNRTVSETVNEARDQLRAMMPPGTTVRTILRHASRSGMTRAISPIIDGEDVSYLVARAGIGTFDRRWGGIKMTGTGMDMGFALVYEIARALYPKGHQCTGDRYGDRDCPSNDHSNERTPDHTARWHSDGGYALKQRWL